MTVGEFITRQLSALQAMDYDAYSVEGMAGAQSAYSRLHSRVDRDKEFGPGQRSAFTHKISDAASVYLGDDLDIDGFVDEIAAVVVAM